MCDAELVMMLRVVTCFTCSVVGVQCRTGDDVESGQEVFHRLARFVLTLCLGQHSNLSGEKRVIDIDGFLMFVIKSHYKSKPDSQFRMRYHQ